MTRAALRESLLTDDLDRFRVVVETLTDEFDLVEVALAAVKLAHEAAGGTDDDEEIPQVSFRPDQGTGRGAAKSGRARSAQERPPARGARSGGPAARLFIGAGRDAGVRPGDLVGAITGETGLTGRDVGAIEIHQRFALVDVPESAADEVVRALRATMIKGRKATIRRDRT
jgi:ATP-dependent RNA helicase DeaD